MSIRMRIDVSQCVQYCMMAGVCDDVCTWVRVVIHVAHISTCM